ncbi:hypothetical protein E2C01_027846 [Portunus trituberculatus]|uniref:Uncharacterized protein n=1 Tax=Portunus trituberculatus TaxID=210409 RepID=A0A5B7EPZ5_PORTR|nr:hypothetical protein [Portunus trituberculatus]
MDESSWDFPSIIIIIIIIITITIITVSSSSSSLVLCYVARAYSVATPPPPLPPPPPPPPLLLPLHRTWPRYARQKEGVAWPTSRRDNKLYKTPRLKAHGATARAAVPGIPTTFFFSLLRASLQMSSGVCGVPVSVIVWLS